MRVLTLDFETTNLDKGDAVNKKNSLVLACWHTSWDNQTYYKWGGEYDQEELVADIGRAELIVAHNIKFELQWLERIAPKISIPRCFDTMLAEYVLAGNRRWSLDLDSVGEKYGAGNKLGLVSKLIKGGVSPEDIPRSILLHYCVQDVDVTRKLYEILTGELNRLQLTHIHDTRCATARALAKIELEGMYLDPRGTIQERDSAEQRYTELQVSLDALSGGLNWNSPKQIAAYIYGALGFGETTRSDGSLDRTDTGNPRTDESTILKLRPTRPDQEKFLSLYREFVPFKKRVQTLRKLASAVTQDGGYLYFNLNQTNTQTHRLSSTGKKHKIQGQNIDRDMKRLVISPDPENYLVSEVDYKQLEFRGAVQLGYDPVGVQDILAKKDIHKFSGSVIFKVPEEEVKGELRTQAKAHTFKPLYGGNSGTKQQKEYYDAFRRRYAGVYKTQEGWTWQVLKTKELVTEYGMRFYWPDTEYVPPKSGRGKGYITNTPSIFNYPVQSFCTAEIVPLGVSMLVEDVYRRKMKTRVVNTVHDSVLAYVHKDEVELWAEVCKENLTRGVARVLTEKYGINLIVPLGIEIKVGTYWGDGSLMNIEYDMEISNNEH